MKLKMIRYICKIADTIEQIIVDDDVEDYTINIQSIMCKKHLLYFKVHNFIAILKRQH